jgi:integrase
VKLTKVGDFYHYRFMVRGRIYHGSTELGNLQKATTAASKIRNEIVMGNLGILERGAGAQLKDFLEKSFLPYVTARIQKLNTLDYYIYGAGQLSKSKIGKVGINDISEEHVAEYIAEHRIWTASGINQGLRTLRRALNLAYEWKKLERPARVRLASGENIRDRVLTLEEEKAYIEQCTEPWKTMATIIVEIGLRPGEVFNLKCEDLDFEHLTVRVSAGKSRAAKRELPMTDAVYTSLVYYLKGIGSPTKGWLFSSPVNSAKPFSQQRAFDWHHAALKASKVADFDPYSLRHTMLTRFAKNCPNTFAVAAVAGHSSIVMTQRYIHPVAAEIREAFEKKTGTKIGSAQRKAKMKIVKSGK